MSVVNNNFLLTADAGVAPSAYQIQRSLRFNSADSAYLNRTPSVAGNRKTWTWAGWVKRSALASSSEKAIFIVGTSLAEGTYFNIAFTNDKIVCGTGAAELRRTTAVYRDVSAWYHLVVAVDTTQATAANRVKIYVNGTEVTAFDSSANPTLNLDTAVNSTLTHNTCRNSFNSANYFDGFLAECYLIDSSFTETNATTGQLVPKDYTGTYGTNGFRLNFSDNSAATAATLGADSGGGISAATGALPIYNTTDNYGITKGTGTRTDSNASSLVLAIPMDGANNGTTFTDESATIRGSGTAKAITVNGNTKTLTAVSKFYGSSGYFDGTGDYLTCASSADFNIGTGDYTFETWIYKTTSSNRVVLLAIAGAGLSISINTSGNIEVNRSLTAIDFTFTASIQDNTWTHIAVTRFGTSLRAFKDGALLSTQTSSTSYGQGICYIGIDANASTTPFVGYIQDLRVYKGVAKYTSNFTPSFGPNNWTPNNLSVSTGGPYPIATSTGALPVYNTTDAYGAVKGTGTRTDSNASSLVLAIPMDGANNGTTFTDESATIKGSGSAKTITRFGDTKTLTAQSKFYGSSGFFDGTGDYLSSAYSADWDLGSTDWTIESWVKTSDSSSNYPSIVGRWQSASNACWDLRPRSVDIGNFFCFVYSLNGTSPVIVNSNTVITDNNWHHIVATRNGANLLLFVDGILKVTQSIGGSTIFNTSNVPLYVGYDPYGATYYNGYIQDLRIYKGVAKYTSNFTPPSATQNTTVAAGNDSLTDTPTSYGTDTGAGGEVRGNYATLNPLSGSSAHTLSNGNLEKVSTSGSGN
jgi:hypothetical protein